MSALVSILAKMLLPTIDVGGLASGAVKGLLGHALGAHFTHIQNNGKTVTQNVSAHLSGDGVSWTNPGADESGSGHGDEPAGERITRVALYWLIKSFGIKGGMVVDGLRDHLDKPVYSAAVALGLTSGMSMDQVCALTAQGLCNVVLAEISGPLDSGIQSLISMIGLGPSSSSSSSSSTSAGSVNQSAPAPVSAAPSAAEVQQAAAVIAAHVAATTQPTEETKGSSSGS